MRSQLRVRSHEQQRFEASSFLDDETNDGSVKGHSAVRPCGGALEFPHLNHVFASAKASPNMMGGCQLVC